MTGPSNGVHDRPSLVRDYLGTEPRKLLYLAGFLVGVLVLVTVPYVWIVGWNKWKTDMTEAGHMMWASYTPAADVYWVPPQGPAGYSVVPAAAPAPPVGWASPVPQVAPSMIFPTTPMRAAPGRQFVCPTCGAVGLPRWTQAGQPVCPVCGGLMVATPVGVEIEIAAGWP